MSRLAMPVTTHDRGLGTAYERWAFYQRMDAWADAYGVTSMLEGPYDGMAGVGGVHGVGLARRGIPVTVALPSDAHAEAARAVYARAGAGSNVDVRVTDEDAIDELPQADLVLVYHALPMAKDWRAYLRAMATRAKKVLIVAECNPDNWGVALMRGVGRVARVDGLEPPDVWYTGTLAPELWEVGRVREHVFFDCPWWPDFPGSSGQSLKDRFGQLLVKKRREAAFSGNTVNAELATKFVYGPDKWPYFGGPGWIDELFPALLRHPGFDGAPGKLLARVAHLHAFVVDVRPRTPQERRRLQTLPRTSP